MDLMNAQEFVEFSREAFNNNYISKVPGASASDPLSMRPSGNRYRYPAIYDDAAYIASLGAGTLPAISTSKVSLSTVIMNDSRQEPKSTAN